MGESLEVALVTFGPGEEVWERFGHNAILIRDRDHGSAIDYNYGIFDFGEANFLPNFLRGHMRYRMDANDFEDDLAIYRAEGRWIVEQDLNLRPAQRSQLRDFLEWNRQPENARYDYDYFRANCSTRVRDALDRALGGQLQSALVAPSRGFTYRMDAVRLMRPEPLLMLGMDAGLGRFADKRLSFWDEGFVPMELMRRVGNVWLRDDAGKPIPLVAREVRLHAGMLPDPPDFPPAWTWQALATGVTTALALLALVRYRKRAWARIAFASSAALIALVLGLAGLVLAALWAFTDHVSAWRNENLLLLNPLCLLLLPAWFSAYRARWQPSFFAQRLALLIAALAGVALFVKVLPWFIQDNGGWIALLLPLHVALAICLTRMRP